MKYYVDVNLQDYKLRIVEEDKAITHILFLDGRDYKLSDLEKKETPLLLNAKLQLEEYFRGKRKVFDLALNPKGTEFQQKVWKALIEVPYGATATYKDIAISVNSPKGFRAVGMANNKNPIPIVIPCHRIIGTNKKLVGYAGGLSLKQALLDLEK